MNFSKSGIRVCRGGHWAQSVAVNYFSDVSRLDRLKGIKLYRLFPIHNGLIAIMLFCFFKDCEMNFE